MLRKSDCDFPGGKYAVDVISDVPNNDELKYGANKCEVGVTGGVSNSKEFKFDVNESNWAGWFEMEYPEATGKYLSNGWDENDEDLKIVSEININ